MIQQIFLVTLLSLISSQAFAERFLNVSSKKMKVTIIDKVSKAKIKQFDLKPLHPENIDLSKHSQGIIISAKPMRSLYLMEKKINDLCQDCGKKIETTCGCKSRTAKKDTT